MEKENLYNRFQTEVKNKDTALFTFMQRVLCMTSKMFVYTGTPETIPPVELERILQTTGNVGIAEVNGNLYALQGTRGGKCDAYYHGKDFVVANPWLDLNKTFKIFCKNSSALCLVLSSLAEINIVIRVKMLAKFKVIVASV